MNSTVAVAVAPKLVTRRAPSTVSTVAGKISTTRLVSLGSDDKLGGLHNKCALSQVLEARSLKSGVSRPCFRLVLGEDLPSPLPASHGSWRPGLWLHDCSLCLRLMCLLPYVSLMLCLPSALWQGFQSPDLRPILNLILRSLANSIRKDTMFKQGPVLKF